MDVNDICRFCKGSLKVGGRITNSKLLFHDGTSTDVCQTLESLGLSVANTPLRSCRICRKCFGWVTRFKVETEKFCEWQKEEASEEEPAVSSTDKRGRDTPIKTPRTKKARRLSEVPTRTSETEVLIKYGKEDRKFLCQPDVAGVIESLARRNFPRAAHLMASNQDLMEEVKSVIQQAIDEECQKLCSTKNNFVLWKSTATDLADFSFKAIQDDLKRLSPFLLGIISTIAKDSAPHICTAAAVALRGRCPGLSALSYYVDMVLLYGGAKKSAFTRLAKLGISTVHQSAVTKQKEMAKLFKLPVSSLKGDLEDFFSSESQVPVLTEDQSNTGDARDFTFTTIPEDEMASLGVAPLPQSPLPQTYSIILDNLDFFIHTHHQSAKNTNKSIHWIHHMCVVDRVPSLHLDSKKPEYCLTDYDLSKSLPGPDTQAHMRREFVILGSRLLTNYLDAFKPLASVVVNHIPHQYSEEMAKPSTHYPLGLLFKNENQTSDLMDVLRHLQNEYAPRTPDGLEKVLVGGDRLTEANSRNIQLNVAEGETVEERLEGLFLKFEDWHAVKNLFEIYHKIFFKEASAKDHGTLVSNMNLLRCSNAKKGPHPAYNAYKEFVRMDTTALFLAATMEHLQLEDPTATPEGLIPEHVQLGSVELKRTWLHDTVAEVIAEFISTDVADLSTKITNVARAASVEKERFPCREPGCKRDFAYRKSRTTHEAKVHGHDASDTVAESSSSSSLDCKKQHTEARLWFGLLLADILDAIKEGDGERLMRLYKVALLIFKTYNHSQYAYSTFLLTVQLNATQSPRVVHSLTWNRFWNRRGGRGNNVPLDLHLEHLNNFLKSFLRNKGSNLTEDTAERVSKTIGVTNSLLKTTDGELNVSRPSGSHAPAEATKDILTLVEVFRREELFRKQPGRYFTAFPSFDRNILDKVRFEFLWQWMRSKLSEFRSLPL